MFLVITFVIVMGILAWVLRPREKLTGSRRLTILAVMVPTLLLAVAAIAFQLFQNASGEILVSDVSNTLFVTGLCLIGVAILALAAFAVKRKTQVAMGIGFSICLAAIIYAIEFGLLEWLGGV
jgi:hypothetical protein